MWGKPDGEHQPALSFTRSLVPLSISPNSHIRLILTYALLVPVPLSPCRLTLLPRPCRSTRPVLSPS